MKQAHLLEDMSLGIRVTVTASQLHLLKSLYYKRGATNEIRHLASKVVMSDHRSLPWERRILKERILIKTKEPRVLKYKWGRLSSKIR